MLRTSMTKLTFILSALSFLDGLNDDALYFEYHGLYSSIEEIETMCRV